MVCEKCNQREATVHITQVGGDKTNKLNLCEECARSLPSSEGFSLDELLSGLTGGNLSITHQLKRLIHKDPRFPVEAYMLIRAALDLAIREKNKQSPNRYVHVSGKELLESLRQLAIQHYGKQAKAVLKNWGINQTEDVGEIVFNMIRCGLLTKQPLDAKEDFQNVYDFDEAFPET